MIRCVLAAPVLVPNHGAIGVPGPGRHRLAHVVSCAVPSPSAGAERAMAMPNASAAGVGVG